MSVTLKQIAAELNVSQPLVTYALNGKPGVSPQMRQAIIETAERLGYHKYSNREARMMAARRHGRNAATGMIALIFPRFGDMPWISVPYYRAMVDGVELEAGSRGLDLIIAPYRYEESLPRIVLERGVDGVIFLSPPSNIEALQALDMPAVSLGCSHPAVQSFLPDDATGIRLAVEHLIELGHRRIAYMGADLAVSSARVRQQAYRDTLEKHGIAVNESLIGDARRAGRAEGKTGLEELLTKTSKAGDKTKPAFTAVACHNDLIAMGVVEQAQASGLEVPTDLSVVGFDDVTIDYHFQPAITSVAFGRFEMGRGAVRTLCAEVKAQQASDANGNVGTDSRHGATSNAGGSFHQPTRIFEVELIVRDSTRSPKP